MNRLAEEIKAKRIKMGLSEKDLAQKCGLSPSYIIQIESGKKIIKEDLAEKIYEALGDAMTFVKVEKVLPVEPQAPKTPVKSGPTQTVNLTSQWTDALAGVIRNYPIVRGKKHVGEEALVIAGKKFDGFHPDHLAFYEMVEDDPAFRIKQKDVVMVGVTQQIENNQIYLMDYYNKVMMRKLRKENNKGLSIVPGLSGGSPDQVKIEDLKILGRVLKVTFKPQ